MFILKFDIAENYMLMFQDAASPTMMEMMSFHHFVMMYLVFMMVAVSWVLLAMMKSFDKAKVLISHKYLMHGSFLEMVWTITPALMLATMAFPSFSLLYLMEEVMDPAMTVKVVGHQWYWSYEYSDYVDQKGETMNFDSYLMKEEDLEVGQLSLLEVDNSLVVPVNTHVSVMVTAADVLHSWAMPSLGVKMDAIPGRLNQTSVLASREGVFYGMCSEMCGFGHQSMPMVVEAVSLPNYCVHMDTLLKG